MTLQEWSTKYGVRIQRPSAEQAATGEKWIMLDIVDADAEDRNEARRDLFRLTDYAINSAVGWCYYVWKRDEV